jgi:hypothetical protein
VVLCCCFFNQNNTISAKQFIINPSFIMTTTTTTTMTKVCFDENNICTYHCGAVMDFDDAIPSDIWYQANDLQQMKRKAMAVAKEANRYGLGTLLTNTYGCTNLKEGQASLTTWSTNGSSRRGLERFINDEYSMKRSEIRKKTIKSVLRAQRKMKEQGVSDVDYSMKVLSRLSEAFSQDSRIFAAMMGIADACAAKDVGTSSSSNNHPTIVSDEEDENDVIHKKLDSADNDNMEPIHPPKEALLVENGGSRLFKSPPNGIVHPPPGTTTIPTTIRPIQKRHLGLGGDVRRPTNDLRHYC